MVHVRRVEPQEGRLLRRVRLAALLDSPAAFGTSHAVDAARPDAEWDERALAGSSGPVRITLFAEGADGVVGLVGGYRVADAGPTVELVSMWVDPRARGGGVGRALVEAVVDWARDTGADKVALGVVAGNTAAERLYAVTGFTVVGTTTLASNPAIVETLMARPLLNA